MCKRNGYYYYFPAGDVSGGQYVLRATALTSDSSKWERLGNFFKPITDAQVRFRSPNHIAAPVQLADGSWWTLGQSYERIEGNDWSGQGRQTSLYPVIWEGDRPWGLAPVSTPITKPNLPKAGILWRSVHNDYFNNDTLGFAWHFLSKKMDGCYSLKTRKGWLQLLPDTSRVHMVQKETDHYYSAVTKINFDATDTLSKAGIYLTNGNQQKTVQLYVCYNKGKKIFFEFDSSQKTPRPRSMSLPGFDYAQPVWLKLERNEHTLTGYYSSDGKTWKTVGASISAIDLDKVQPNYNSWVGTSIGLFAEGKPAFFDQFVCKDGFSLLPAVGYSNYYGVEKSANGTVTNTSKQGGWLMIAGVELGNKAKQPTQVCVQAMANTGGNMEIWIDDLQNGKLIATIPIAGSNTKTYSRNIKNISGRHDVFVKFPAGKMRDIYISNLFFK